MNINAFDSKQVKFSFQLPVDVAIANLKQSVLDPKRVNEQGESMVGSVSGKDTYIYRGVPATRNSFRPTFYGSFSEDGSETILTGTIGINRVIKKFMFLWLGIVALVAIVTLITILTNPAATWGSLLQVIIMFAAVYAMFVVLINKCEPDIDWLKSNIEAAIHSKNRA